MFKAMSTMLLALATATPIVAQKLGNDLPPPDGGDYPIKYAIYSSAWGERSNAGLRLVAQNQSDNPIVLESILFRDEDDPKIETTLDIDLTVPPHGWAESEMPYTDLLFGNECINHTMGADWKLVEISNYTLNPSVRGLIIEDSDSFRIYQCVRNIFIRWKEIESGKDNDYTEWVMYHFERKRDF